MAVVRLSKKQVDGEWSPDRELLQEGDLPEVVVVRWKEADGTQRLSHLPNCDGFKTLVIVSRETIQSQPDLLLPCGLHLPSSSSVH